MKYGAYYDSRRKGIVWFRTHRSIDAGFYHRHKHGKETPDVYISGSVPDLIMKSYPWIHAEEDSFQ